MNLLIKNSAAAILLFGLLPACNHTQKITATKSETASQQSTETANLNKMQQSGVDFYGSGNEPVNWNLQMNYDDTIRFTGDDGLAVKFAYNRLKKDVNAERSLYTTKLEGGADVSINVFDKSCSTPLSKFAYSKQVTFTYNNRTYSGCGRYLVDNNLNNKWLLEKINNNPIKADEYNRIPVFQFDLAKQKVTGNDGCNTIGGNIEVQGNRIKFSGIFATRMACMKKDISGIISSKISDKLVNYYFKDGKLYFYLEDDSLLVFGKG